ncbi:hypothetical protein DAH43_28210 [Escherichia coli]|nr:hypothetical protein DAH43_28210 [Escherichia coli]
MLLLVGLRPLGTKKGRAGLPSPTRLVPWITHRSQHLADPLKPAKRRSGTKKGRAGPKPVQGL